MTDTESRQALQLDVTAENLLREVLNQRLAITAFLRTVVRNRHLADDLFQDLCVLVMQKQGEVEQVVNLGSWLRSAGRKLAMNALRKRAHSDLSLDPNVHDLMAPHWDGLGMARNLELANALESCLQHLSAASRRLVHARYVSGLKLVEVARQLNRPVGSLYVTMARIHKRLAECIVRKVTQPEGIRA